MHDHLFLGSFIYDLCCHYNQPQNSSVAKMNLSSLLPVCKEAFEMRGKATFWFGAIFSEISQCRSAAVCNDLESIDYCFVIKVLNQALLSAMEFYPEEPTDSFYHFLEFCGELLLPADQSHEEEQTDFNIVMGRAALKNNLIIHSIKEKHYSLTLQLCSEMIKEFKAIRVDGYTEIFLVFFSNYAALIRKLKHKESAQRTYQMLCRHLEFIFTECLKKIFRLSQIPTNEVEIIVIVFRANLALLKVHEEKVLELLAKGSLKVEKSLEKNPTQPKKALKTVESFYQQNLQKNFFGQFQFPFFEFARQYQMQKTFEVSKKRPKRLPQTRDHEDKVDETQERRISRIQKMLSKSIEMMDEKSQTSSTINADLVSQNIYSKRFRRLSHLPPGTEAKSHKNADLQSRNTIEVSQFHEKSPGNLTSLSNYDAISRRSDRDSFTFRSQVTSEMISPHFQQPIPASKRQQKQSELKAKSAQVRRTPEKVCLEKIQFKVGSIFVECNEDGLLLSDYTNQNKRFIEWNTFSRIIPHLQMGVVSKEYLRHSVVAYYDLVRIIRPYLSRDPKGSVGLFTHPTPIFELNEFVRFFAQDGSHTVLALMNRYDSTKLEGTIGCYFEEFGHFFKTISRNEYLQYLSANITDLGGRAVTASKKDVFYLEMVRRKQESVKTELEGQLGVDSIEEAINDRQSIIKGLFLLRNNNKLYCKVKPMRDSCASTNRQPVLELCVRQLPSPPSSSPSRKASREPLSREIQLPLSSILHYVPMFDTESYHEYLRKYGRLVFAVLNNFQDLTPELNLSVLSFSLTVHVYLTEMIQIGRYWTMVSAELVGTRTSIAGLVLRYNFLPANLDIVTLLYNSYAESGFLAETIALSREDKKAVLKRLLIDGSPKATYLHLEKANKINQVTALSDYLSQALGLL